jgi:hypothetical protein
MDGGRQGDKRGVGAARRRSRGHGPARLDGTRPRATVASKVMESGKMAGQATAANLCRPHGKRSAQARIWKPGRRRQPSGARERWKPEWGETPQAARCAARQRDRPCLLGRGRPSESCDVWHLAMTPCVCGLVYTYNDKSTVVVGVQVKPRPAYGDAVLSRCSGDRYSKGIIPFQDSVDQSEQIRSTRGRAKP